MTHKHLPPELREYIYSRLIPSERGKTEAALQHEPVDLMLMYSGALLNWIGEYLSDSSLSWTKQKLRIDDLTLTGTGPEWNEIVINKAGRSPSKLRELMKDTKIRDMFKSATAKPDPILVRVDITKEGRKLKVLDGMTRIIAAIRDGVKEIEAWVAERSGKPQPEIEPHVIYDFLKAYDQGRGDKDDLISSLRFLIRAYRNTRQLLETRFNSAWVMNQEINGLVKSLLEEK